MSIEGNVKLILSEIPENVNILAAVKTRNCDEINSAIKAGIHYIGHNYVQEALSTLPCIKGNFKFHFIGHLQRNKVKYIIDKVDMIETVDSVKLADTINKQAEKHNRIVPILIEVNSGKEENKSGVFPENVKNLIIALKEFSHISIQGLMTMAPYFDNPEKMRPYFRLTKQLYDEIKNIDQDNVDFKYLSMGMSDSYRIAIEEGANLIRIGTKIFGPREK